MTKLSNKYSILVLLTISSTTLLFALCLPFCELRVSTGDSLVDALTWWVFGSDFSTKQYSVLGGIGLLVSEREYIVAGVIAGFSVVFPLVKHTAFWWFISSRRLTDARLAILESFGPLSLVDPFVVAVSVLAFKRFPGGGIAPCIGFYLFVISVVTSLVAGTIARRIHSGGNEGLKLSICTESVAA